MIDLSIQIKLIIFSFIFGFFFSIFLDVFNKKINNQRKVIRFIFSFFIVMVSTFIYFEGINKIGNAIFHIYSIIMIILGFFSYDLLIWLIANKYKK